MSCAERAFARGLLLGRREAGGGVALLRAAWEGPEPRPGQFFMLRPEGSRAFLGRPLSVFDAGPGRLDFLVARRGEGTRELASLPEGAELLLAGPLGSAWPPPPAGDPRGRRPALIAGGVGLAPLAFLARRLPPASYELYAGFRAAPFGLEGLGPAGPGGPGPGPARLTLSSEEGIGAPKGRILDLYRPGEASALYVCGPEPLLAAAAARAREEGIPAWLSLERRMACGVGACLGCVVPTRGGNRRACVEGPVFPAEELCDESWN